MYGNINKKNKENTMNTKLLDIDKKVILMTLIERKLNLANKYKLSFDNKISKSGLNSNSIINRLDELIKYEILTNDLNMITEFLTKDDDGKFYTSIIDLSYIEHLRQSYQKLSMDSLPRSTNQLSIYVANIKRETYTELFNLFDEFIRYELK